jgi:hypothetical protein
MEVPPWQEQEEQQQQQQHTQEGISDDCMAATV